MPFQEQERESYVVAYKQGNERVVREGCLGVLVLLGLLCLASIFRGGLRPLNTAVNLTVWLTLVLVYGLSFHQKTPRSELWVCGETFCMVRGEERGRAYRFAQITRVRRVEPMTIGVRMMKRAQPFWQIEVDGACVAVFDPRMENAQKLLATLGARGLITPYATGADARNLREEGKN